MAQTLTPLQILAAARIRVKTLAPYMTAAVLGLIPREAKGLATMGVTDKGVLLWNPEWVSTLSADEVAWVLLHEASHLLRDHSGRCKRMCANHRLFNIAGDLEINDDLREMGAKLPNAIYPETFGEKPGGIAEVYYRSLYQQAQKQGGDGEEGDEGSEGEGQSGGDGKDTPKAAGGWCGSGGGRPVPGEPKDGEGGKGQTRSAADLQRIRLQVAKAVKEHVSRKGQGSVPLGLQVWADGLLVPSRVPWSKLLARALRAAVAYTTGSVDYTYGRPSRRQGAVGWGKGFPVMPTLRAPKPRVAVAVDTSGSMGQEEIVRAASEAAAILSATRAEVQFLACDAAVHTVTKLRNAKQLAGALRGGGGTSFVPIFEALGKMHDCPDTLVVLTDGGGDAPAFPPARITRTIWVLMGKHKCRPLFHDGSPGFGTFIEIDE